MFGYLKNLSTFRLLLLLLFGVSAAAYLYGRVTLPEEQRHVSPLQSLKVVNALMAGADNFGNHLAAVESVGLSLAMQFEMVGDSADSTALHALTESVLKTSHPSITGVAIGLSDTDDETRLFSFTQRDKQPVTGSLGATLAGEGESYPLTAREINLERRMRWRLVADPPGISDSRLHASLAVAVDSRNDQLGETVVRTDLDWLKHILQSLGESETVFPLCVTPDGNFIWLEDNRLYFTLDYQPGQMPNQSLFVRAKRFIDSNGEAYADDFIKSDILGSGWQLLVANPNMPRSHLPVTLVAALISGALLAGEVGHSLLRKRYGRTTTGMQAGDEGGLRHFWTMLLQYRLANPRQERLESELNVARDIQFSLVPNQFPPYSAWREFDLHALLSPAREIGGDYYDFFMPNPDRIILTVGDVSGKGAPAALYMAVCRTAFRSLARHAANPADIIGNLNNLLVRDNSSGLYVTLAVFSIHLPTGKAEYVLAGHPAPLLFRAADGATTALDEPRETLVGLQAGILFPSGTIQLRPGDTVLLYTDGVTEAGSKSGQEMGQEGLRQFLAASNVSHNCRTLVEAIDSSVQHHIGTDKQADDITLLAFRYWGPGGRHASRDNAFPHGEGSVSMQQEGM